MQAINGGIKSYPITMVKGSMVFILGDTNEGWERYKDVPLMYLGIHSDGHMMFETPYDGTIYLNCPTMGCVIPPEYVEHMMPEPNDFVDAFDDSADEVDNTSDFETHKAKNEANSTNFQAVLRAAALSLDKGELGQDPDSMMVIFGQSGTFQYRPVKMSVPEQLYCLEWCKNNLMSLVQFEDLGDDYEDFNE